MRRWTPGFRHWVIPRAWAPVRVVFDPHSGLPRRVPHSGGGAKPSSKTNPCNVLGRSHGARRGHVASVQTPEQRLPAQGALTASDACGLHRGPSVWDQAEVREWSGEGKVGRTGASRVAPTTRGVTGDLRCRALLPDCPTDPAPSDGPAPCSGNTIAAASQVGVPQGRFSARSIGWQASLRSRCPDNATRR